MRFHRSSLRASPSPAERLDALAFDGGDQKIGADEAVVLAVPAPVAARLVPGLDPPDDFRAIVNAHYRIALPIDAPLFVGLVGGTAEWVFRKRAVLSRSRSAPPTDSSTEPAEELAALASGAMSRLYAPTTFRRTHGAAGADRQGRAPRHLRRHARHDCAPPWPWKTRWANLGPRRRSGPIPARPRRVEESAITLSGFAAADLLFAQNASLNCGPISDRSTRSPGRKPLPIHRSSREECRQGRGPRAPSTGR